MSGEAYFISYSYKYSNTVGYVAQDGKFLWPALGHHSEAVVLKYFRKEEINN